jgi:hypothetical protein
MQFCSTVCPTLASLTNMFSAAVLLLLSMCRAKLDHRLPFLAAAAARVYHSRQHCSLLLPLLLLPQQLLVCLPGWESGGCSWLCGTQLALRCANVVLPLWVKGSARLVFLATGACLHCWV